MNATDSTQVEAGPVTQAEVRSLKEQGLPGYYITRDGRLLAVQEITPHRPKGRQCRMAFFTVDGRTVKRSLAKLRDAAFGGHP